MEFRKVTRLNADGSTAEIQFSDLRVGDRFILDGGEGDHEDGKTVYIASGCVSPIEPPGNSAVFAELA